MTPFGKDLGTHHVLALTKITIYIGKFLDFEWMSMILGPIIIDKLKKQTVRVDVSLNGEDGIETDVQKPSLEELKVKVYDEENKIMQVNKIRHNAKY